MISHAALPGRTRFPRRNEGNLALEDQVPPDCDLPPRALPCQKDVYEGKELLVKANDETKGVDEIELLIRSEWSGKPRIYPRQLMMVKMSGANM